MVLVTVREPRGRWRWPVLLAVVVSVGDGAISCGSQDPRSARPLESAASGVATATSRAAPASTEDQNPARYAALVVRHAGEAKVNPQVLMAILYNESYKPHDPALERAWQKIKPDSAFGVANMHKAAFDETKRGRDFSGREWQELPDSADLAIDAAAWHLYDLAVRLPATWRGSYTKDELLALGYNAGAGTMTAIARGVEPDGLARSYVDRLRENWAAAGEAVRHG